jgi:Fic family protein
MNMITVGKYQYLEYSYREGKESRKIRIKIDNVNGEPSEADQLQMLAKIYEIRWKVQIEEIRKNYHIQFYSLPKPIQVKNLHNFGIRFTHNTNKIEGSSLSLADVIGIIEDGITPTNKPLNDTFEAKKHMELYEKMCNEDFTLTWDRVLNWHKILFHETKPSIAGDFRQYPVEFGGSNYVPPASSFEINLLLDELLEFWNEQHNKLHPVILACIMHFRFVSIHPFGDGNGRISRVLMNSILYHNQYPMFDIPANIRRSYYSALERANLKSDESIFLQWFIKNYLKENAKYLSKSISKPKLEG